MQNHMARSVLIQRGASAVHGHVCRQAIGWGHLDIACRAWTAREDASWCCRAHRVSNPERSLAGLWKVRPYAGLMSADIVKGVG